ncbi:MAG TPA: chorismate mutase [Alphaproteobacteria bacterium]|nr:chorismate mutase [Alphaproteobacteria bacterium]
MPSSTNRLDLLRRDIDAIDVAIHDLIVKRATIVEDIRKIKNRAGPALRPGREASIVRALVARHRGKFPLQALVNLWREMISGFTHMQEPLSAAVYAPRGRERLFALARDHYGSLTPLQPVPTAAAAVRAVADQTSYMAVLPFPGDQDSECWWPLLIGNDKAPRVISRLPFASDGKGEQALVLATWARDPSDEEATLVVVELPERASRGRVVESFQSAGFAQVALHAGKEAEPGRSYYLVEVDGQVAADDTRLAIAAGALDSSFAQVIGGYARPLTIPAS